MAGIGFELRKAIKSENKRDVLKGYAGAAFSSNGSMIVGIVIFTLIQIAANQQHVDKSVSDSFMCYVTNIMFLSMIVSSSVSLVLSRYAANMIYMNKTEEILPGFFGGIALTVVVSGTILTLQLALSKVEVFIAMPLFFLLISLCVCWVSMTYVTLIRDYIKIVIAYGAAFVVSALALLFVGLGKAFSVPSMILILFIGFSVVDVVLFRSLYMVFSKYDRSLFGFRDEMRSHPQLIFIGLFLMIGMLGHFWLVWFLDDSSTVVTTLFRFNAKYDFPAIVAYFSTIPASVFFVTLFETDFSEKYQKYFAELGGGDSVAELDESRDALIRSIKNGMIRLASIQLITCLLFVTIGAKILGIINIGMTAEMLSAFRMFCVGYSLFYLGNTLVLLQLYFTNDKKALVSAAVFAVGVIAGTYLTICFFPVAKGLAFLVSSAALTLLAGAQLIKFLSRLEYNILCKSPIMDSARRGEAPKKTLPKWNGRNKVRWLSFSAAMAAILVVSLCVAIVSDVVNRSKIVTYYPKASTDVLLSPGMGLAPWADSDETLALKTSLVYVELKWADWEPEDDVFNVGFVNEYYNLDYYRDEGRQVVFRFISDEPSDDEHIDIPQWLFDAMNGDGDRYTIADYGKGFSPNYKNEVMISEHAEAVAALGETFGKDDFFTYVEMGSLGHWGEWHVDYESGLARIPDYQIREEYVKPYLKAFPNAKLLLRYPLIDAKQHSMGLYNDLTGDYDETLYWLNQMSESVWEQTGLLEQADCSNNWKKMPIGGEFAQTHENGYFLREEFDMTLEAIKMSHQSFIGPKIIIDEEEGNYAYQMKEILNTLGYRYRVNEVKIDFSEKESVNVSCTIVNDGIAPIYSAYTIQIIVYDSDGVSVWSSNDEELDLREVLPEVSGTVSAALPKDELDDDMTYILAISIVDKDGHHAVPMALSEEIEKNVYKIAEFSVR